MIKQYFYLAQWFIRARFFGRRAPLQTVLFITDKCNLRCKHCSVYGSAGYRQRKFDDILEDMKRSYKAGSRFIDLEGGEPTLWKEDGKTINDIIDAAMELGFFSVTVTTNAQQDFSWIHPHSIWVSMDGIGKYHEAVRGEGTFAKLEENIARSGKKHICVNMVINSLNWESLDAAMEYVRNNPAIEQISVNFHTPYPGTEHLKLPNDKKAELIDKVLEYKKKGYPIMNSSTGLRHMRDLKFKKVCWMTNYVLTDGTRSPMCAGSMVPGVCEKCGFCMAGEERAVVDLAPDTIFAGLSLRVK